TEVLTKRIRAWIAKTERVARRPVPGLRERLARRATHQEGSLSHPKLRDPQQRGRVDRLDRKRVATRLLNGPPSPVLADGVDGIGVALDRHRHVEASSLEPQVEPTDPGEQADGPAHRSHCTRTSPTIGRGCRCRAPDARLSQRLDVPPE